MSNEKYEKNPFANHIKLFTKPNGEFNPSSVSNGLERAGGSHPDITGEVIARFNAGHITSCPFYRTAVCAPNKEGSYAPAFHLGTTRIWKENGEIDEAMWEELVAFVTKGQEQSEKKVVKQSVLMAYLEERAAKDPEEAKTGRNTKGFFASKNIQCLAAREAWKKTFELLATYPNAADPSIPLEKVRAFFENTEAAFLAKKNDMGLDSFFPEVS